MSNKCWSNWTPEPKPEDRLEQPRIRQPFDGWSFLIGIVTAVGCWLWYWVIVKIIF